jgi:hypothetical protein
MPLYFDTTRIMSSPLYECSHCGKNTFKSQRGLTQHQKASAICASRSRQKENQDTGYFTAQEGLLYTRICQPISNKRAKHTTESGESNNIIPPQKKAKDLLIERMMKQTQPSSANTTKQAADEFDEYATAREDNSGDEGDISDNDINNWPNDDNILLYNQSDDESEIPILSDKNRMIMLEFREYLSYANKHFRSFTKTEETAIKCMVMLRKTKASLSTYNSVMEWHLKTNGELNERQTLGETKKFFSKKRLMSFLKLRYNIDSKYHGFTKTITLPSSMTRVNMICNDAGAMVRSLITDPRVRDEDYLFFDDDDPFAGPPLNFDYLGDINTGLSYRETYRQRITNPAKQILLPIQVYADGCATGQFANLNITQLKIALGIHNAEARDKDYLWRDLAFIPQTAHNSSRGRRIMLDSGHCDGIMQHQDALEAEGVRQENAKINKLEDYHAMLSTALESYVVIQDSLIMDFVYKGKLYPETEFLLYIAHCKLDNEEASKFCGQYSSKTQGTSQICRECHVPTQLSGRCLVNYPPKLKEEIRTLVENNDEDALKQLSQHNFTNAFWQCHFGLHNDAGIHGACMLDILHTLYLGIFLRVRDAFFAQVGPTSQTSMELDALAKEYGVLLERQSERDLPKSKFSKGIMGGKLMAKEYEGVLLLIALLLRCTAGRKLIMRSAAKIKNTHVKNFEFEHQRRDWTLLVETLLGWIQWLKSSEMQVRHVDASEWKHRFIMHLIKKIMKRTTGMGMKFVKFHIITHLTSHIKQGGVPMMFDTGTNESGHKPTKTAAMLTQKRFDTFDQQTNERLLETHLLSLAMEEMAGRPLWKYIEGYDHMPVVNRRNDDTATTGGAKLTCDFGMDGEENTLTLARKTAGSDVFVEGCLVDFIADLQETVGDFARNFSVRTEHSRNGQKFRGHMKYRGGVWRDWVEVDWGEDGYLPCKIWGFADLRGLPVNSGISFAGVSNIYPGVYAIVECGLYPQGRNGDNESEICVPVSKEVGHMVDGCVTELKFYLADVESFLSPIAVVADIGGPTNSYFLIKSRLEWREDFEDWLDSPNYESIFDDSEDESEDEDYESDPQVPRQAQTRAENLEEQDDSALQKLTQVSEDEVNQLGQTVRERLRRRN